MPETYQDRFSINFHRLPDMMDYHIMQSNHSRWERVAVNDLFVEPLDKTSALCANYTAFAASVTEGAVDDTVDNLGLALTYGGERYPLRDTAYKSLLDRARIGGSALLKLKRSELADTLNLCLPLYRDTALVLVREQKVTAAHSGGAKDYSILPVDELLESIKFTLDERFPGNAFNSGYSDHAITDAEWSLPNHKDELLGTYRKTLEAAGQSTLASKLMPGIRFSTSDTGTSAVKVSALILGLPYPMHIGGAVSTEHRGQATIQEFQQSLSQLFAKFTDSVARLEKLTAVYLDYPVNVMTAICKNANVPESKMLLLEENMARALTLNWVSFDTAKAVTW